MLAEMREHKPEYKEEEEEWMLQHQLKFFLCLSVTENLPPEERLKANQRLLDIS